MDRLRLGGTTRLTKDTGKKNGGLREVASYSLERKQEVNNERNITPCS